MLHISLFGSTDLTDLNRILVEAAMEAESASDPFLTDADGEPADEPVAGFWLG